MAKRATKTEVTPSENMEEASVEETKSDLIILASRIPKDLHRRVRIKALLEHKTASAFVAGLLENYLAANPLPADIEG